MRNIKRIISIALVLALVFTTAAIPKFNNSYAATVSGETSLPDTAYYDVWKHTEGTVSERAIEKYYINGKIWYNMHRATIKR